MVSIPSPLSLSIISIQQWRRAMVSPRVLAVLALIGANIIWGASPAASKGAMAGLGPMSVGAGRAGLAVLVFALLLSVRHEQFATGRVPAVLGLFDIALFAAFQNVGLLFADATATALIGGAKPVLIAGLAVPLLGERLQPRQVGGLLLSMAGVAVIVLVGSGRTPEAALGNLLPLASAVSFSLYAVLSRRAFDGSGSLAIIAGATRYGFLFLLPAACLELAVTGAPTVTAGDAMLMLYLGAGCSALAFVLCGYGYAHLSAAQAAPFSNLKLLAGVGLAVALLGESLTTGRIMGGLLVLLGVAIATMPVLALVAWVRRLLPAGTRALLAGAQEITR